VEREPMKCPVCGNALTEIQAGSIKVQACKDGCAGIWVNHFQLDKIDKPDEYDGAVLAKLQKKDSVTVDLDKQLNCPQCQDHIPMMRHFFSVKREVLVNECPECGGYWLNMGELLKIRQNWKTDDEREKAADDYFTALFGTPMAQDLAKDEVWETKAKKVYDIFKYICPSHYFKDQNWNKPF
jgi:uncharacterized protein